MQDSSFRPLTTPLKYYKAFGSIPFQRADNLLDLYAGLAAAVGSEVYYISPSNSNRGTPPTNILGTSAPAVDTDGSVFPAVHEVTVLNVRGGNSVAAEDIIDSLRVKQLGTVVAGPGQGTLARLAFFKTGQVDVQLKHLKKQVDPAAMATVTLHRDTEYTCVGDINRETSSADKSVVPPPPPCAPDLPSLFANRFGTSS
jgi:hypothetical protein